LFSFHLIVVGWFYVGRYVVLGTFGSRPFGVQTLFEMPVTYSYLTALSLAMVAVTLVF
jgi:hypothetical protein